MANVLELFAQPVILDYLNQKEYPAYLGETLFPEVKKPSLKFEYLRGSSDSIPTVASVHSFDTEAEIGSREAYKQALKAALIKRKIGMDEEMIIQLENPRFASEEKYLQQQVFRDVDNMVNGVKARVEGMRMEALSKGKITVDENGLSFVVDYKVPTEHKKALTGTSVWTDTSSDPLKDILDAATALNGQATRALTSSAVVSALLSNQKVISGIFGAGSGRFLSLTELNTFLAARQLPVIATYDNVYFKEQANGTKVRTRYLPANSFTLFGDGTLGETLYGPTAEETRLARDPAIDLTKYGNVLAMVYEEGKDPVSTWIKAVATAMPSFPAADDVFQLTPIA